MKKSKKSKFLVYGHNGTIHRTNHVDVETNAKGQVVAVWFRCMLLPFKEIVVNNHRALEMYISYANNSAPKIHAVTIETEGTK